MFDELKEKAQQLPEKPGVYMMRDREGRVIYIGKAKSLRARVSSYFTGRKDAKSRFLIEKISDFDLIFTTTEFEALVLENNLIKKHLPKYNISLKDGKSYPVIRITLERFPRVFRTRRVVRDGSTYFGPYPDARAVDIYINMIYKLYQLRRCRVLRKRDKPCLYHHIGCCSAPCVDRIGEEEYGKIIRKIKMMLSGKTLGFKRELEKQMREAAAQLAFERAGELRDALKSLELLETEQNIVDFRVESKDYIGYAASGRYLVFAVIKMRGGQIVDRELYVNEYGGLATEALTEFLIQYYAQAGREFPSKIYLPERPNRLVDEFFAENSNVAPKLLIPAKKKDLVIQEMTRQNAGSELDSLVYKKGDRPALEMLQQVLSLPRIPRRIEGFDIAQLGGRHTVASMILFVDGRPERAAYRHYKILSTDGEINDFKAIAEVVARRCQRLLNEEKALPDLILVDGGRGQVSAAWGVLEALNLSDKISLVGLAKKNEELWQPGSSEAVKLPEGDPGLRVLQYIRNEAHRFATSRNQRLRARDVKLTTLEGVPGIGPARSAKLLGQYKSLEGIYDRTLNEIAKTAGVGMEVAEILRNFLGCALENKKSDRA